MSVMLGAFHLVREIEKTLEDFALRADRKFKEASSTQLAGAREQPIDHPVAHLDAQTAARKVLAIGTTHHASIGANFFHPFGAHRVSQIDHLVGDAMGLKLARK